tara:strand:+ start:136 stop:969 length:834 start_codon:yes stop_codon:yes gene_type:complete
MAKKQEKEITEEAPVVKTPVVETPKPKRQEPTNRVMDDGWEVKDRRYVLKNGQTPLSYSFKSRGIYYYDKELGYEREIQLTENQKTVFVDEFKGQIRPARIVFRNGVMFVPKEKITLQKMLSIYHPQAGHSWFEVKPKEKAMGDLDVMEMQIDALVAAREIDIDLAEAIMRVEMGSRVSELSSKELKRDLLVFARSKPKLFLELMKDDNVHLRNIGIKAVEQNIMNLSGDQRTFTWASTGRKLMNVPFEEHPYTALAHWFKTDEGMEVLKSVEKQLA